MGQYLQAVTPRLAIGSELAYQRSPQMPGGHVAILSIGARYAGEFYSFSKRFILLSFLILTSRRTFIRLSYE